MDWWQIALILLLIGLISIMVGVLAGIPISNFVLRRQNQGSFGSYRISPKFESKLEYPAPERLAEFPEKHEVTELQAEEPVREATIESEETEAGVSMEQAAEEPRLEIPVESEEGEAEVSLEQAEPQVREPVREATIESEETEAGMSAEQAAEESRLEIPVESEEGEAELSGGETEASVIDRLLVELEHNRELTIESNDEKLMPFQTQVWDESRDALDMISVNLQWELTQAYLDMVVANNIVWFLREFERKSPDLDEQYTKMCKQIAERLDKIIPMLETAKQMAT